MSETSTLISYTGKVTRAELWHTLELRKWNLVGRVPQYW